MPAIDPERSILGVGPVVADVELYLTGEHPFIHATVSRERTSQASLIRLRSSDRQEDNRTTTDRQALQVANAGNRHIVSSSSSS